MSSIPKILHVDTEKGWRGGQQQAVYLHENLIRKGFTSHFICKKSSKLADYLRKKKLPYHEERLLNEFDIYSGLRIAIYAKKYNYNIIQLHSGHALSIGIYAKIFYPKLKIIASRRVDFSINKNFFSRLKYRNNFVDRIIAISENIRDVLISNGILDKKISVIRSGIDINKFNNLEINKDEFKNSLNLPPNSFVVGTVAALVGHKDYPNMLKAAGEVIRKSKNIYFIAVGSGKDEIEIKNLAKFLNLEERFIFLGYRKDIGTLLKVMDIFVLASKQEGLGTSILDAMSVGLPIIGTNAGGIPEAVENEFNGIIVPKRDFQKLSDAILYLFNNEELRQNYAKNSLIKVKNYNVNQTVLETIQLYEELLS